MTAAAEVPAEATTSARVSVIIPTHGSAERLERCLDALHGQTMPPFEVIVVDNGLLGGAQRVRSAMPGAIVVTEKRPGSYAARNRGIETATGDLLAFTDDDCEPASDWLEQAAAFLRLNPHVSLAAGAIEVRAASDPPTPAEMIELRHGFPQEAYVRLSGFGATANLVVRRRAFQDAGLFDPELLSGGDFEWCRRAQRAGLALDFAAAARVRHPARRTAAELFKKERRVAAGLRELLRRGRLRRRDYVAAVITAALPPVVHGSAILADRLLGPLTVRLRAALLLAAVRMVRLRMLVSALSGRRR